MPLRPSLSIITNTAPPSRNAAARRAHRAASEVSVLQLAAPVQSLAGHRAAPVAQRTSRRGAKRLLRIAAAVFALVMTSLPFALQSNAHDASDRPPIGAAEKVLFDAANRDRAAHGLQPLRWDPALANAARAHAQMMAQRNELSHQFPGEAAMQQRASQAGARFSMVSENVALGPSVSGLHTQWMNSAPHRANLLDKDANAVGIAVVQRGASYFAVEDFSASVASMDIEQQEKQVASQLAAKGLNPVEITDEARHACNREHMTSAKRPLLVLRYETSELKQLPDEVVEKLQGGKYHSAAVAACQPRDPSDFSSFRLAILLY